MKSMLRLFCCGLLFVVSCLSTNSLHAQWVQTNGPYGGDVACFAVSGTDLFVGAGSSHGVFLSTNNGASWGAVNTGLTDQMVYALAVSGTNLFAGTYGGGVFLSTNNGTGWTAVNTGLANTNIWSLAVGGTNLFAGTWDGGVWRRPLSEMITSVELLSTNLPARFSLGQNYPNPFNPTTIISFQLATQRHVTLKVFDALGREVTTLVNEMQEAGNRSVEFSADHLPSGVYFYRLQAGTFTETKKLVVLR